MAAGLSFWSLFCVGFSVAVGSQLRSNLQIYPVDGSKAGRTFDGIGALSGGGATSRLLPDYPETLRSEILDYLFKPNFGASLHILKLEIGGDAWSGCGTEPSHMHTADDLSYTRGYEWWLMQEAMKRNPDIIGYGLPWGFPAWIGSGCLNENQVEYIVKYVEGARKVYGFNLTWIGIWNEQAWSPDYIKALRAALDEANYQDVHIVAADNALYSQSEIVQQAAADPELAASISRIGVHYPTASTSSPDADASQFPLWSSEDDSSNDNSVGGGCWARLLNWNYVYGNYTSTIMWNLVTSYYFGLRWYGDSMMDASQPWSGYYEVKTPVFVTAHTTQFTKPGWKYLLRDGGSGELAGGGTYVTMVSPDGNDFSIIVETMQYENSLCIRSNPTDSWTVATQNVTFELTNLPLVSALHVWKSVLFSSSGSIYLFEQQPDIPVVNGQISFTIEPDALISLTTTVGQLKGGYTPPPTPVPFPLPHVENFDSYSNDTIPLFFSDQCGSFSVRPSPDREGGSYYQNAPASPSGNGTGWANQDSIQPLTIIGDWNIGDASIAVSAYFLAESNNLRDSPVLSLASCDPTHQDQVWVLNSTSVLPNSIRNGEGLCADAQCPGTAGQAIWMWSCVDTESGGCDAGLQYNQRWNFTAEGQLVTFLPSQLCFTAPSLTLEPCLSPPPATQKWVYDEASLSLRIMGMCLSSRPPPAIPAAVIALRVGGEMSSGGCGSSQERQCMTAYSSTWYNYGYFFSVFLDGSWQLSAGQNVLSNGTNLEVAAQTWFTMNMSAVNNELVGFFNDQQLFSTTDATWSYGWAALGSGWHPLAFDNFTLIGL